MGPSGQWILIFFIWAEIWGRHLKVPHPFMTQRAFVLVPLLRNCKRDLVEPQNWLTLQKNYLSQLDTSDVRKLEQWTSFSLKFLVVKMGIFAYN